MSDEAINSGCSGGKLPDGMSVGALIRAAADGELTDEQVRQFEALCAERDCTKDRVRFEQTLKECCGRALKEQPCCPDALRSRIAAMAPSAHPQDEQRHEHEHDVAGAGSPVVAMAGQTRKQSFWRRSPATMAAAAVLMLAAGVLIYQGASLPTGPVPAGWTAQQVSNRDQMAGFVAREHGRCCKSDRAARAKLIYNDPNEARSHFAAAMGVPDVDIPQDAAPAGEVRFMGAGDCHVPAADTSGHLRFDAVSPDGTPMQLSLFVVNDRGQLPIEEGVTYHVPSATCDDAGVRLFAWRQSGVVYLLVTEAEGAFCTTVRQTLHAPAEVRSL